MKTHTEDEGENHLIETNISHLPLPTLPPNMQFERVSAPVLHMTLLESTRSRSPICMASHTIKATNFISKQNVDILQPHESFFLVYVTILKYSFCSSLTI